MAKMNVAIIFGSRSPEHDISIMTALGVVFKGLKANGQYNLVPIYIDKQGRWFSDPRLFDLERFTNKQQPIDNLLASLKPIAIDLNSGFSIIKPGLRSSRLKIDCVFPALHGGHGEDGEVMALLNLANVAYVGCDVGASQIAMDKVLLKQVADQANLAITKFVWFYSYLYHNNKSDYLKQIEKLKYPLFVKPAHLGSSIAISKVHNKNELEQAIDLALFYDDKVLVEEGVNNLIELTLPIIGNNNQLETGLLERPLFKEQGFFDFNSKYILDGQKSGAKKNGGANYSQLPAKLPTKITQEAIKLAIDGYKLIGCSGIARVDLLLDSLHNKLFINEINPMPGDLYLHNWQAQGLSAAELCTKLINFALERYKQKQQITSTFKTNYLNQFTK